MAQDRFGYSTLEDSTKDMDLSWGEGDMGYSMHALKLAKDNNIINRKMTPIEIRKIMEKEGMDPYGFIVDKDMLKEIFNNG